MSKKYCKLCGTVADVFVCMIRAKCGTAVDVYLCMIHAEPFLDFFDDLEKEGLILQR